MTCSTVWETAVPLDFSLSGIPELLPQMTVAENIGWMLLTTQQTNTTLFHHCSSDIRLMDSSSGLLFLIRMC